MFACAVLICGVRTVACLGDEADPVDQAALALNVDLGDVAVDAHAFGGRADRSLVDTFFRVGVVCRHGFSRPETTPLACHGRRATIHSRLKSPRGMDLPLPYIT